MTVSTDVTEQLSGRPPSAGSSHESRFDER
jgi:hypothetical protein